MHVRSGVVRRKVVRRPAGERRDSLGFGSACGRAEVRLFDRLFTRESLDDPEEGKTFLDYLNPESLRKVTGYLEPSLAEASVGDQVSVRTDGLFLHGPRFGSRQAGFQPDRHAERQLGQNSR